MESISPELALVDPALRTQLAAELAEPDDCLTPVEPPAPRSPGPPARPIALPDAPRPERRSPSQLVPRPTDSRPPAARRVAVWASSHAAAPALAPSLDARPAPSPVRLVPPAPVPEAVPAPLPLPDDRSAAPVAADVDGAAGRRPARVAARVAVVGVLVAAPFVGPVIVDLVHRV